MQPAIEPAGAGIAPAPARAPSAPSWAWWAALAAVAAALAAAYAQELGDLVATWSDNPDYSHGYLVPPLAAYLLYRRWPGLAGAFARPSPLGWLVVVACLAAQAYFHESGRPWFEQITLFPLVFGLALALGGWRLLRWAWPGLAFLLFMFPLPGPVNHAVSQPLQRLGTVCTVQLLRLTGLWATAEGNVIYVGAQPLEVARACNGLSMLMSLAATVTALVLLVPMPVWKRLVLMASIVPVALVSNILRITGTAWSYHAFGAEVGEKYAHDWAGLLMMPVALALVGLEMLALSWLFVEEEEQEDLAVGLLPMPAAAALPPPRTPALPPLVKGKDAP